MFSVENAFKVYGYFTEPQTHNIHKNIYVEKHSVQEMSGTKNKEYTFIKLLRSDCDMSVPHAKTKKYGSKVGEM